ncbi:hypothetical protein [Nocardia sp. NPDC004415]
MTRDQAIANLKARAVDNQLWTHDLSDQERHIAESAGIDIVHTKPAPRGKLEEANARVAILETEILAGKDIPATALAEARALAQAEADIVDMAARGARERDKAAKELAKRQEAAKAAVRQNLPVLPADELATLVQAARDALAAIVNASRAHAATIQEAKQVLADGGVIERDASGGNTADEQAAMDWDNHGLRNAPCVVIDGTTYSPGAYTNALVDLGRHALGLGGAGHRFKFGI